MDGVYEMASSPFRISLDGKEWIFSPVDVEMWGEIELQIISKRPHPEDILAKWIPQLGAEDRRVVLEHAWRESIRGPMVSQWEVSLWESTITGKIFKAYLRLKRNHPEVTLQQADIILRAMN